MVAPPFCSSSSASRLIRYLMTTSLLVAFRPSPCVSYVPGATTALVGRPLLLSSSTSRLPMAAPKRPGAAVDGYRTVSVNCAKCSTRLFRYKKKNGTKSNLIKCYLERIVDDVEGVLSARDDADDVAPYVCPKCDAPFARPATIHGRPAMKFVGGKIRMTKK